MRPARNYQAVVQFQNGDWPTAFPLVLYREQDGVRGRLSTLVPGRVRWNIIFAMTAPERDDMYVTQTVESDYHVVVRVSVIPRGGDRQE